MITEEQKQSIEKGDLVFVEVPAETGPTVAGRCHVVLRRHQDTAGEFLDPDKPYSASWNTWSRGQTPAWGSTPQEALDRLVAGGGHIERVR